MPLAIPSKLFKVNKNCDSLRTTIPNTIKDILELQDGGTLTWAWKCGKRGCIEVIVSNGNKGGGVS
jgi:hypothetical protein